MTFDVYGGEPKHTQTIIDATQKETAIDQQQQSCETLICQRHQTILRLLSSAATASTRWRVRELYCPIPYVNICRTFFSVNFPNSRVTAYFMQVYLDPDKV